MDLASMAGTFGTTDPEYTGIEDRRCPETSGSRVLDSSQPPGLVQRVPEIVHVLADPIDGIPTIDFLVALDGDPEPPDK